MYSLPPIRKTIIQALIFAVIMTAPFIFAESGVGPRFLPAEQKQPTKDSTTPAQLAQTVANHQQGFTGAKNIQVPHNLAAIPDIHKNSTILQHGDTYTILPPQAVIHTPKHLRKKITRTPHGRYVAWPTFYVANRNWILTHHLTLEEAKGNQPITPAVLTQFDRINRIVVSVYQNQPISKLASK